MQHPHSNPLSRTPEITQRAQTVLAVTATAYGLTREKDRPRAPGPESEAGNRPRSDPPARTGHPTPERALEAAH